MMSLNNDNTKQMLQSGIDELCKQFRSLGINHRPHDQIIAASLSRFPEEQQLEKVLSGVLSSKNEGVTFMLVVFDDTSSKSNLYSVIKYVCDVRYGILNTCVVLTRNKFGSLGNPQYYGNVAIKINLKLRGLNQTLPKAEGALDILHREDTMVVGIDVTHPAPDSPSEMSSIASVVASYDDRYAHYPASIKLNPRRQEQVDLLREMMEERLEAYKRHNEKMPKNILVYRDGVGESQYEMVLNQEGKAIDIAIRSKCPGAKVSIVVVGKRHHTRFFSHQGTYANPLPGTIVDTDVTMEKGFDFFLQAHYALKGTAKPAHYVVVRNDMKISVNSLQTIVSSASLPLPLPSSR